MLRAIVAGCIFLLPVAAQTSTDSKGTQAKIQADVEAELRDKLVNAKRIFVDDFGDDAINKTLRAMVIDSLRASKRFIVTENKEKADLVLKGASLEKTTQEAHALGSATSVGNAAGGHTATVSGGSGTSKGGFIARQLGISDSEASVETVNDARLAVRLVSQDGDVVWSTTQESKGAKYKGATADVADKVVKQLLWDLEHANPQLNARPK